MRTLVKTYLDIAPGWWLFWLVVYLAIIVLGVILPQSDILTLIKLGGVIMCFIYAWRKFPKDRLLQVAMFFTCVADLILAVRNTSELGVIMFFVTQLIHMVRLRTKRSAHIVTIFALVFIAAILANWLLDIVPLIYLVSCFYAVAITVNIYLSFDWRKHEPHNMRADFAAFGFMLFACCDSCTVISYFALTGVMPMFYYGLANFMAWFFYYPSQILVSNSSRLHHLAHNKHKLVRQKS